MVLIAANAFFVTAEYGLVTVDRAGLQRAAQGGDRTASTVLGALRRLSFQLSGAQLGITVTALLTGYLAEPAIAKLVDPALRAIHLPNEAASVIAVIIGLIVANVASMLFGELIPKNAALARPEGAARFVARPQRMFSSVFKPVIALLNSSANFLVARLGIEPQEELASARTPEELGLLAARSAHEGALPPDIATLLQRTIRFPDKRAAEAMTPRRDVTGLPSNATVSQLLNLAKDSGHSDFPIYLDTMDSVVGVAGVHEGLTVPVARRARTLVRTVATQPVSVPDSLPLDDVLERLRSTGAEIAVVVDEYGGTDGIISAEDLIEELVGEIADEHDVEADAESIGATTHAETVTAPDADNSLLLSGLLREDELYEASGFRLPDGPFETLAGFLMYELQHVPDEGEQVHYNGWDFAITAVERHRVEQVRVTPPPEDTAS